ncbi:hypothetical protein EPA93_04435 [Ktedonosporobacter rubrisoli]|uniref:Uncharacterized protein n=1 Tax=Ktedonosporobacter rubrisoli TaxID=2509675 RepID=A0A4P6JJJ1_KTERU|nr:hypothetical protein [Ktedonosporobacter rubrisoli]QBD75284.1 hypothetical protein EPA93_04435 [Ktedonosporobacter rubrisoli]
MERSNLLPYLAAPTRINKLQSSPTTRQRAEKRNQHSANELLIRAVEANKNQSLWIDQYNVKGVDKACFI